MKKNRLLMLLTVVLAILLLPVQSFALADGANTDVKTDESDAYDPAVAAVFAEDGEIPVTADGIDIPAPSAILIEKETGTVLYEKDADERLEPASVTKVMTLLLIAEAVDSNVLSLDDTITVSANAASMGGSQIYLEEGETMSAKDLLKSIVVSSANDACVAMAEHLAGSEEAFVAEMNTRAAELGMTNTTFTNCTGLPDGSDHKTTARDIAIMSRELILNHPWIEQYTTIWMDTVRNGQFGLSNTNKLIYYYNGATGLKTGYTSSAGYCLSATAMRDGVEYIAVILDCTTSAERFESAKTLLNFAFANYTLVDAAPDETIAGIPVELGTADSVTPVPASQSKLLVNKNVAVRLTKTVDLLPTLTAPVKAGDVIGTLTVSDGDSVLTQIPLVSCCDIARLTWWQLFKRTTVVMLAGRL